MSSGIDWASLPDGLTWPKIHIGERRAAGLAEQTGFENALGVLGPRGHGDDGAVGQHDHDVLVRGGDLFEQGDLLGGHVEGFAIEALDSKSIRRTTISRTASAAA